MDIVCEYTCITVLFLDLVRLKITVILCMITLSFFCLFGDGGGDGGGGGGGGGVSKWLRDTNTIFW